MSSDQHLSGVSRFRCPRSHVRNLCVNSNENDLMARRMCTRDGLLLSVKRHLASVVSQFYPNLLHHDGTWSSNPGHLNLLHTILNWIRDLPVVSPVSSLKLDTMFRNALRQSSRTVGGISATSRIAAVSYKVFLLQARNSTFGQLCCSEAVHVLVTASICQEVYIEDHKLRMRRSADVQYLHRPELRHPHPSTLP